MKWFISVNILLSVIFIPNIVMASASPGDIGSALDEFNRPTGISETSVTSQIATGMLLVYQLTGFVFFMMALYSGIRWMTASGNEEVVTKSRNTLIAAVIGFVLVVAAYGITLYLTERVSEEFGALLRIFV